MSDRLPQFTATACSHVRPAVPSLLPQHVLMSDRLSSVYCHSMFLCQTGCPQFTDTACSNVRPAVLSLLPQHVLMSDRLSSVYCLSIFSCQTGCPQFTATARSHVRPAVLQFTTVYSHSKYVLNVTDWLSTIHYGMFSSQGMF